MANKFLVVAGGNWTADTSWSTTDGGANDTTKPTALDDVFLTSNSGQCTINASTAVGKSLDCTGYTNTLTHNAFNLTISGSVTLVSGMTYTPLATSTITLAATGTLTTGGKLLPLVVANTGITVTLGDNVTTMASKVITFTLNGNSLDLNGKTLSGNSSTNRLLIRSDTLGTARTITNTTGTFANADFRDITLSSAADLSAITGLSGDAGGNSGITFTTAATQTYTGGTDSWSTAARWTSRVPLPQDNVSMAGVTGGTITADMPRLGKSIDWTGASGSPTWSISATTPTLYGSLTFISAMTYTTTVNLFFEGRGSFTYRSNGLVPAVNGATVQMVGGTLTLSDAASFTGGTFDHITGTFNDGGFTLTCNLFQSSGTSTRVLNMSGVSTATRTSGNAFTLVSTGLTLNHTGTFIISNTGASSKTFAGGGLTYNNLQISGGGAGAVIITGSNTFNKLPQIIGGGTKTLTITPGTTQTFNTGLNFGNGSSVLTINTGGATATFTKPAGAIISADFLNLTNIIATETNKWYAGGNSTDGGGNTNWIFSGGPGLAAIGISARFGSRLGTRFGSRLSTKFGVSLIR